MEQANIISLPPFKDILNSITTKDNDEEFLEILSDVCNEAQQIYIESLKDKETNFISQSDNIIENKENNNVMETTMSEKNIENKENNNVTESTISEKNKNINNVKKRKMECNVNNTNKKIKIALTNTNIMINLPYILNHNRINDLISNDYSEINFITNDFDCKNLNEYMSKVVKHTSMIVKNKINFGTAYLNNIIHLGRKILDCVLKSLHSNSYEEYNEHVLSVFDTVKYNVDLKIKIAKLLGCPYELNKSKFLITDTRSFIIISHISKCDFYVLEKYARIIILWFINIKNLDKLRNVMFDYICDEIKTCSINKKIDPLLNILKNNVNYIDMLFKYLNTSDKIKSLLY